MRLFSILANILANICYDVLCFLRGEGTTKSNLFSTLLPDKVVGLPSVLVLHVGFTVGMAVGAAECVRRFQVAVSALAIAFMRDLALMLVLLVLLIPVPATGVGCR